MQSALLILSPLDTAPLHSHPAAELAISLKNQGIKRVDLTADSHYHSPHGHGNYAVPAFTAVARNVAEVMDSVIGQSRMYDLPAAMDRSQSPSAATLLNIARNCLTHTVGADRNHDPRDTRDLAFVFYAAIHAGGYDRLVFPRMSNRAQMALFIIAHNLRDRKTLHYGHPIRLDAMRERIFALCGIKTAPKGAVLN